jgi:hypothetical protein
MDKTLQVIENIVDSAPPLVSIETARLSRALDMFKALSLSHENPFYQWSVEDGLHRMGASHIVIPRTRQPEHLLEYIHTLQHSGIFLLPGFAELLTNRSLLNQFKQILVSPVKAKTIILIDAEVALPEVLQPYAQRLRIGSASQQRQSA